MASTNSVLQRNSVCIPKICLDNYGDNVDEFSSCFFEKYDDELFNQEDSTFGMNELIYFSRLCNLSKNKKFIFALILLTQCNEGYRCAIEFWLRDSNLKLDIEESFVTDANNFEYLNKLQSSDVSNNELFDTLKKLIPYFRLPCDEKTGENNLRRGSTPASYENVHEINNLTTCTPDANYDQETQTFVYNQESSSLCNFHLTKRKYLELVSQIIVNSFTMNYDTLIKEVHFLGDDLPFNELIIRTSPGRLLLIVMLHKVFTQDDRHWLLSVIKTKYTSFKGDHLNTNELLESVQELNVMDSTDDMLRNKLFECLMDLGSDISHTLHYVNADVSLSHSLTSSGFLSGYTGGSDSQYDLLIEVPPLHSHPPLTESNRSSYGHLLTVPNNLDAGGSNVGSTSVHKVGLRRLSDLPVNCKLVQTPSSPSSSSALSGSNIQSHSIGLKEVGQTTFSHLSEQHCHQQHDGQSHSHPSTLDAGSWNTQKNGHALLNDVDVDLINRKRTSTSTLSETSSLSSGNFDFRICRSHSPLSAASHSNHHCRIIHQSNTSDGQTPPPSSSSDLSPSSTTNESTNPTDCPFGGGGGGVNVPLNRFVNQRNRFNFDTPFEHKIGTNSIKQDGSPLMDYVDNDVVKQSAGAGAGAGSRSNPMSTNSNFNFGPYSNSFEGMDAVPIWLKSLRLHKYVGLFQSLSYDEMMCISDEWLINKKVTQGARNKILLSIERLHHRLPMLMHIERCLLEASHVGPIAQATLHSCLTQIKSMLRTPIKPCHLDSNLHCQNYPNRTIIPDDTNNNNNNVFDNEQVISQDDCLIDTDGMNQTIGKLMMANEEGDITVLMIKCLAKVCCRLLMIKSPELDLCEQFLQILEIIIDHSAFSVQQKKLASSWKMRLLSIHKHVLNQKQVFFSHRTSTTKSDANFKSINRSTCTRKFQPHDSNHHSDTMILTNKEPLSTSPPQIPAVVGCLPWMNRDLENQRRHSVPVNDYSFGLPSVINPQRRRMPSPNPPAIVGASLGSMGAHPVGHSEFEPNATMFKARFKSPLNYAYAEHGNMIPYSLSGGSGGRNLMPPTTAPTSRMPSPCDTNRVGFVGFYPVVSKSSHNLTTTDISPTLANSLGNQHQNYPACVVNMCSLEHVIQPKDLAFVLMSSNKSNVQPSNDFLLSNQILSTNRSTMIPSSSPSYYFDSSFGYEPITNQFGSEWPSCQTGELMTNDGSSNDRINRDLDLLTRQVTELAIGGGLDSLSD